MSISYTRIFFHFQHTKKMFYFVNKRNSVEHQPRIKYLFPISGFIPDLVSGMQCA